MRRFGSSRGPRGPRGRPSGVLRDPGEAHDEDEISARRCASIPNCLYFLGLGGPRRQGGREGIPTVTQAVPSDPVGVLVGHVGLLLRSFAA